MPGDLFLRLAAALPRSPPQTAKETKKWQGPASHLGEVRRGWRRRLVRYNNPGSGNGHGFGYWARSDLLHPTRKGRRPQTSRMPLRGCANSTIPNKAAKPREPPPGWPLEPLDPCALGTYPPAPIPSPFQKPRLRGGRVPRPHNGRKSLVRGGRF